MAKESRAIAIAVVISMILFFGLIGKLIYNAVNNSEPKRIPPPPPMKKRRLPTRG